MFGKNKILKVENHLGDFLMVVNIFKTLQGEGPFSGEPAIFVRLGGCNLKCSFCDTEFDNFERINLNDIVQKINTEISKDNIKLIVITGGEPLRQPIEKFCGKLLELGFKVQIETNGTIARKLPQEVHIVCSPKITNKKYNISENLIKYADSFKFLLSSEGDYKLIPKLECSKPIYVQPIDSYNQQQNLLNQKYTMKVALKYGYIYSIQQHKILNIE
ncbi:MAG: 7-carboxy-7-deazaguanine synthase QueE [Alphaproteobacteria bacterium]|jgi:7-carboxy-7-deazaguanine synthase|nr:7-carboxy-7-deazaguanine synthase QueE [Alphaproteobacteria bacterium]MBT5827268.1 7-carboxy-7-deazaguanine synthase QueE [Alphaproteobacteria bacterium]